MQQMRILVVLHRVKFLHNDRNDLGLSSTLGWFVPPDIAPLVWVIEGQTVRSSHQLFRCCYLCFILESIQHAWQTQPPA